MQFEAIVILFPFFIYSHFSGTELEMEFMERAFVVEELTLKIEKLESENEALKEEAREQGTHVEVLTKENLDLQSKVKAASENNGMLKFFVHIDCSYHVSYFYVTFHRWIIGSQNVSDRPTMRHASE